MAILKLNISNLEVNRESSPYSELSSDIASGATSSILNNAAGFDDGYFILFGEPSGEQSELVAITSISTNTVTHPATKYAHNASTPVYCVAYNQIKIYRLRDTTESLIATIDMQFGSAKASTEFYGDAETGDKFASSFFNSEDSTETNKSEWVSMDGYAYNSKHGMAIRAAKLFQDKTHDVIILDDWFNWQHEAIGQLTRKAQDKDKGWMLVGPTVITDATEAEDNSNTTFPQPSDCRVIKQVEVNYGGDTYYQAYPEDVQDADACSQSAPVWSFNGDDIMVRPGKAQKIRIRFYPVISELSDNADIPSRPIADYDYVIVNYMLMRAFEFKMDEDMIGYFERRWEKGVAEMLDEIDKRQRDRPKKMIHPNPLLASTRDSGGYI